MVKKPSRDIIVRMQGGLGNQLFIYACALFLKQAEFTDSKIFLDTRGYKAHMMRQFELDKFIDPVNYEILSDRYKNPYYDITAFIYRCMSFCMRRIGVDTGPWIRFLSRFGLYYSTQTVIRPVRNYHSKNMYVYGYFQDSRMTDIIKPVFKKQIITDSLSEHAALYGKMIDSCKNPAAVSIRTGSDYVSAGWNICSMDYYKDQMKSMREKNGTDTFFIFADEIDKMSENFRTESDVIFVSGCTSWEQLLLMSRCRDFIISNSSFAWWGAYLSDNTEKTVVVPKRWFSQTDTSDTALYTSEMRIP